MRRFPADACWEERGKGLCFPLPFNSDVARSTRHFAKAQTQPSKMQKDGKQKKAARRRLFTFALREDQATRS